MEAAPAAKKFLHRRGAAAALEDGMLRRETRVALDDRKTIAQLLRDSSRGALQLLVEETARSGISGRAGQDQAAAQHKPRARVSQRGSCGATTTVQTASSVLAGTLDQYLKKGSLLKRAEYN